MPTQNRTPRILITRIGAMGDVLHALPAVTALRQALPEAHLAWVVDPRWAPLLDVAHEPGDRDPSQPASHSAASVIAHTSVPGSPPLLDQLHLAPTRLWKQAPFSSATGLSILHLRRDLLGAHYDIAVDLQGTLRSAVITWLSGAPRRLGPAVPREAPARFLYRERVRNTTTHVVEHAAELLSSILGSPLDPATKVILPFAPAAEVWATQLLADAPLHSPMVLLAPTAGWGAKMWPTDRFGCLARQLADQGATVLVNSAGPHDTVAEAVIRESCYTARAVASTLPQLVALTRRAALVVAGDTGPLHLAAALGRPVVALFGPTDPARNGPWFPPGRETLARVLRDALSVTDHTRRSAPEPGLLRIDATSVFDAAMDMLGETSPSTKP